MIQCKIHNCAGCVNMFYCFEWYVFSDLQTHKGRFEPFTCSYWLAAAFYSVFKKAASLWL